MKNNNVKIKWEEFINEYAEYFLTNEEIWDNNLEKIKLYINKNKRKPNYNSKNNYIKQLAQWINTQLQNYKNNNQIMKNTNIKIKWDNFLNEYKEYFISNEEVWYNNLEKVKLYINENKCKPVSTSKDYYVKQLNNWISTQQQNYKNNKNILKNYNIKIKWEEFINEYKEYFISNKEIWNNYLEKVIIYINENKCKPSQLNKNKNIKQLGRWIKTQDNNYKKNKEIMKDNTIKLKWEKFINEYKNKF
jgi:hypothetical protein